MENLFIEGYHGTFFIPTIDFNAQTGVCEISGESYLEETTKFYEPIIKWLEEYLSTEDKPLTMNFKLTYFNTSSSKCIVEILSLLKKYQDKGKKITVNWYYDDTLEDAEEEIEEVEDFMAETGININLIPYSQNQEN